jgi:magnesium transporter
VTSPAGPSAGERISVAAFHGDAVREWADDAALKALEGDLLGGAAERHADTVWIDLTGPSEAQVTRVAGLLGLHPLIAEDIIEGNQRSKIEVTDGLVHIVLFALEYEKAIYAHEIDLVLGQGFLLSVHPPTWDPRAGPHFRDGLAPIMKTGADHLLWAIFDMLVDD